MDMKRLMNKARNLITPKQAAPVIGSGKTVAIIHFNTPELTEAAILSLRKHGGESWQVVVFDNSDQRPWDKEMDGVIRIDNTKGQYVDFDAELAKYPDKQMEYNRIANFASVKHMLSVQKLWDLIPGGFILLESDVLLRKDISFLWDERFAACGKVQWLQKKRIERDRLAPFLCYLNVPLLKKHGARYFDPQRSWGLLKDDTNPCNWYDTGACLLEDIVKTKPALVARNYPDLDKCFVHYTNGSWRRNNREDHLMWLQQHKDLWQ